MLNPSDFPAFGPPSPLLVHRLLDRPRRWIPDQKIIYRDLRELTYTEFLDRVHRLAQVLRNLGVRQGDRVGVLDWDSHRYLECFFAVPMMGAILHTINVRLSPEQTLYTINHAGDETLLIHPDFLPLVEQLAPRLTSVKNLVVLSDDGTIPASNLGFAGEYESLVAATPAGRPPDDFDENTVATLFYTTGTTGDPKGVFFTHRQIVLHTLGAGLALAAFPEPLSLRADDVYLPVTPMFHVHAWGVPYVATLLGLKQVYPGRYEPHALLRLMARHQVTFSHCVPTILQMLIHHPAASEVNWPNWKVIIGGAALPLGLAKEASGRGIRIMAGYGMSETCPIVAVAHVKPSHANSESESDPVEVASRSGFPIPLVQAAILDEQDAPQDPHSTQVGELALRAPWLTAGYFRDPERSRELWRNGWLHTGDLAFVDPDGYLRITDRLKDVIKIGGEWISSLELEGALSQHPAVREVAVVGVPDTKWDERPQAEVVLREEFRGQTSEKDLQHFLHRFVEDGALHKRAILTRIHFLENLPKTSVGKVNKRQLRQQVRNAAPDRQAGPGDAQGS